MSSFVTCASVFGRSGLLCFVVAASAGRAIAQPCGPAGSYGLRGYFRIVNSVAGGTGLNEVQTGGTTYGLTPVNLHLSNSNSNAGGCLSEATATATANFGDLSFIANGSGHNCATNGVLLAIDQSGGGPTADSSDQLNVSSATLPLGTPVDVRVTWTLSGSGAVIDASPSLSVESDVYVGSPFETFNHQMMAPGSVTHVVHSSVGTQISLQSNLTVTMAAQSLSGGTPASATMNANFRVVTTCVVLTPGARFTSCGGGTYAACSPDFNGDGDVGTDADIEAFFACLSGTCCATCGSADFNGDGDTGTDADIDSFFRVLAGGAC